MDKFLEAHKPPKLTQEETENLNRTIIRNWVNNNYYNNKSYPQRKPQAQLSSLVNTAKYF